MTLYSSIALSPWRDVCIHISLPIKSFHWVDRKADAEQLSGIGKNCISTYFMQGVQHKTFHQLYHHSFKCKERSGGAAGREEIGDMKKRFIKYIYIVYTNKNQCFHLFLWLICINKYDEYWLHFEDSKINAKKCISLFYLYRLNTRME